MAIEVATQWRELEEEARRNEEEIAGAEEGIEGENVEVVPPDDGARGHNDEGFNFVMVPWQEGVEPDWGIQGRG